MSQKHKVYDDGIFSITIASGHSDSLVHFLDKVLWGSQGVLYRHKNIRRDLSLLPNPKTITLNKNEIIIASMVSTRSHIDLNGQRYNSEYFRYFAAADSVRGAGIVKQLSAKLIRILLADTRSKTIFYGCIEKHNKVMHHIAESMNFKPLGTIKSLGFSRVAPKISREIYHLTNSVDQDNILGLLKQLYSQHGLVNFDGLFTNNNYYVIRENGEVVAGCQYQRGQWAITHMKGRWRNFLLKVIPKIPFLKTLIDPTNFEFLGFDSIFLKPGYEHKLHILLESLLAREKLRAGLFWMGEHCPIRRQLTDFGGLGLIHCLVKNTDVKVVGLSKGLSTDELTKIADAPMVFSARNFL